MLNTVARVGKVLKLFTTERPEWGVTEVAGALGLPKSNAHEMLASLVSIGLLERRPAGRYRLGWRLLAMSRELLETDGFQRQADTVVSLMARRVGQPASVAAWDGRRIVCVARAGQLAGAQLADRGPGVRLPGHSTALGKVLLAHRTPDEVAERVDESGLPQLTSTTITSYEVLRAQLDAALEQGIAFDYEENSAGVSCVAAPVRDADARVVAALSISMPTAALRRAEHQYVRAVGVAAHRLTTMISAPAHDGAEHRDAVAALTGSPVAAEAVA